MTVAEMYDWRVPEVSVSGVKAATVTEIIKHSVTMHERKKKKFIFDLLLFFFKALFFLYIQTTTQKLVTSVLFCYICLNKLMLSQKYQFRQVMEGVHVQFFSLVQK